MSQTSILLIVNLSVVCLHTVFTNFTGRKINHIFWVTKPMVHFCIPFVEHSKLLPCSSSIKHRGFLHFIVRAKVPPLVRKKGCKKCKKTRCLTYKKKTLFWRKTHFTQKCLVKWKLCRMQYMYCLADTINGKCLMRMMLTQLWAYAIIINMHLASVDQKWI